MAKGTLPEPESEREQDTETPEPTKGRLAVVCIYCLYLAGLGSLLPWLIGAVIAFFAKSGAAPLWANHSRYQIRSFWFFLSYIGLSLLLLVFAVPMIDTQSRLAATLASWIPFLALAGLIIWFGGRCLKGLLLVLQQRPHNNPYSLGWSAKT